MNKLLSLFTIAISIFITSCAADKEDETLSPSSDSRDQYVGYWNASETSALAGINTHVVNISKSSSSSSEIIINNFSGLSVSARASINNNSFSIPYQVLASIGFTQGSGTINSSSQISLSYTTTTGPSRDSCTAIYTKQ